MPNNRLQAIHLSASVLAGKKISSGLIFFLYISFAFIVNTQNSVAQRPYNIRGASNVKNPHLGPEDNESHWAEDNDSIETIDVPIGLKVWTIDENFGTRRPAVPDTLTHLFQNDAFTEGRTGHYAYTGNLGAPRMSRIFTDNQLRMGGDQFIFAHPYDFFISTPSQLLFTNTKSPFTNITYHECGNKQNGEDRIRGIFSTNVNKRLGVGFKLDYLYGRGYYASQSTAHFNGTIFGSYRGERYDMHTMYYANHLKNTENGGIDNDDYVLRPEIFPTAYAEADMPTRLDKTWNKLNINTFYLTHRYNLGFERATDSQGNIIKGNATALKGKLLNKAIAISDSLNSDSLSKHSVGDGIKRASESDIVATSDNDSLKITTHFVPVISFIHTARIDHNNRLFLSNRRENATASDYFNDFYLPGDSANDYTSALSISNLFAVELREGFNKWAKSGIRLYAKHAFSRYSLPDEAMHRQKFIENHITAGAQLIKEQGHYLHYDLRGELRTSGSDWGEFNVEGKADLNFPLRKDTLRINWDGYVRNIMPTFYFRHYHARNAWWDNNLSKEFRARIGGNINYKQTTLSVYFESLQNYTHFAETQTPYTNSEGLELAKYGVKVKQTSGNIQLIAATLRQNFKWGILNWENELTYQMSSDKNALPLPAFMAYSNLYLRFRIAKVLHTEFGGDVRYFTEYAAPTYSPIIGQYAVQDPAARIKVGNYPTINVYANFHLRNTRFYVMGSHVNYSSGSGNPFWLPHYPMNRLVLRLGISWNFFN